MPDPWPKQCPYMDRCERSVIATLVNTKMTFNNIGGATTGSIDGYVFSMFIWGEYLIGSNAQNLIRPMNFNLDKMWYF